MKIEKPGIIVTPSSLSVSLNHTSYVFDKGTTFYKKIRAAAKKQDWQAVAELVELSKQIEKYSNATARYEDGILYIDDEPCSGVVRDRILDFMDSDDPYEYLVNFVRRLRKNPSNTSVNSLYGCLEANHHPILPDGRFLAYKKVRKNFTDCHSGKFDNSVGKTVEIRRNQVDENIDRTCSYGLHVASFGYAKDFYGWNDGVLLEVAVDPADVVAVPRDYNNQKMRVCKYEVLGVSGGKEVTTNTYETTSTSSRESY